MPLPAESGTKEATRESLSGVLVADDPAHGGEIVALLEPRGYRVQRTGTLEQTSRAFRDSPPALLILSNSITSAKDDPAELRDNLRNAGIPVLEIVEEGADLDDLVARSGGVSDWVFRSRLATELPARVARLVRHVPNRDGKPSPARTSALDPGFIPLLVHDLRTPLNVVGLSLRMIDQAMPRDDPEVERDLRFVEENFEQMKGMLAQLSDYYQLFEPTLRLDGTEFSPQRLVDELLESRKLKPGTKSAPAQEDIQASCPESVQLDQIRARTALDYALSNASAAAGGKTVRVVLRGEPDRWITEVRLDQPPPDSVKAHDLHPHRFERLCGTASERRGMELAIVARVTQIFGGSARLEVENGNGTAIVLDWPTSLRRV
jgi:signal transduction histidine kinase